MAQVIRKCDAISLDLFTSRETKSSLSFSQQAYEFLPLVTLFHCLLVLSSPTATQTYLYRNTLLPESVHQAVFVLTHKCRPLSTTFLSPNLSSWQMGK